jgi:hypothetical protein
MINHIAKASVCLFSLLFLVMVLAGCGGDKAASDASEQQALADQIVTQTTKTSTAKPASSTKSTTKPATTTTKKVVPKLTDLSFTLDPTNDQEFAEYTTPIYILASQTLHLNWQVVKGGEYFYLTFTLPNGKFISVRSDGGLSSYIPGEKSEQLRTNGSVVFYPANNDWGDGYYIFHSQIFQDDPAITLKLLYYVE